MSNDGSPPPDSIPCAVCALPIPRTARLCTHCNCAQNPWVRWARRVSVVAAGIVALLPLVDAASSLRSLAAGQHKADVRLRAVDCQPSGITIAAMNFGRGPAFLRSPALRIEGGHSGTASELELRPDKDAVALLEPSGTVALKFTGWVRTASVDLPRRSGTQPCLYRTTLVVEDTSGTQPQEAQCECPTG